MTAKDKQAKKRFNPADVLKSAGNLGQKDYVTDSIVSPVARGVAQQKQSLEAEVEGLKSANEKLSEQVKDAQQIILFDPDDLYFDDDFKNRDKREKLTEKYQSMKASIRDNEIREPITVKQIDGKHYVVKGHQRTMIAKDLKAEGLSIKVPAMIRTYKRRIDELADRHNENYMRSNPAAYCMALECLKLVKEDGYKQTEVAKKFNVTDAWMSRCITLAYVPEVVWECYDDPTKVAVETHYKIGASCKNSSEKLREYENRAQYLFDHDLSQAQLNDILCNYEAFIRFTDRCKDQPGVSHLAIYDEMKKEEVLSQYEDWLEEYENKKRNSARADSKPVRQRSEQIPLYDGDKRICKYTKTSRGEVKFVFDGASSDFGEYLFSNMREIMQGFKDAQRQEVLGAIESESEHSSQQEDVEGMSGPDEGEVLSMS